MIVSKKPKKSPDESMIEEIKLAFERVFKSSDGELILGALGDVCIKDCGNYESELMKLAFNNGKVHVFITILNMINLELSDYIKGYRKQKEMFNKMLKTSSEELEEI